MLDLEHGMFTRDDPHRIAESLRRSAEANTRRRGSPLQSAMSMLEDRGLSAHESVRNGTPAPRVLANRTAAGAQLARALKQRTLKRP